MVIKNIEIPEAKIRQALWMIKSKKTKKAICEHLGIAYNTKRLDNIINAEFVEDLYDFDNYVLEDFLQTRSMNRNIGDYVGENELVVQLAKQGEELGMRTGPGTTFYYYKAKDGYLLEENVESLNQIDIKYHWDIINNLLKKFSLESWIRKKPSITVVDRNQQSLLEFV